MCSTTTHPPSDHQYISFQGHCCRRTPLVHPDCPFKLELICAPGPTVTVPLRGHAPTVCVGSEALQVLKPPPPAPYIGRKNATCCTQIPTVRLSGTHCGGLHTSLVHWPSAWRAAMGIFSGWNCRKTVFPSFACPMQGLQDAHTDQKVRPICPQH